MSSAAGRHCRDICLLAVITVGYLAVGLAYDWLTGQAVMHRNTWDTLWVGLGFGGAAVGIVAGSFMTVFVVTRLIRWTSDAMGRSSAFTSTWADYRQHLQLPALAGLFIVLALYVPFMNVFMGFKQAISSIQAFGPWDVRFMHVDRWIHAGHHPWALLHILFGKPIVTKSLDILYYIWFPAKIMVLVFTAWKIANPLNRRFLVSFFLLWVLLGNVVAIAFSSAGPCYYGSIVEGPDPYGPLMTRLHATDQLYDLIALDVQNHLWNAYSSGRIHLVEGIAAMPSLHVAVPVLWTIWGWKIAPVLGTVLGVYAIAVLVGSVHLGWHYAVDGYVTFLLVPVVWWATGRALEKYDRFWAQGRD